MSSALWISLSGASSRLQELDVVSNNLANADTVGFKRAQLVFSSVLETAVADLDVGPARGAPGRVFPGTDAGGLDLSIGPIAPTGGGLDVAIEGPGFFEVETLDGPRYTRAGAFVVGADGVLATPAGDPVVGEGGPIAVASGPARILGSGEVVDAAGTVLGRLKLVGFEAADALEPEGGNLFRVRPGSVQEDIAEPRFAEASLERSNVRPVEELAGLVLLQRSFDTSMRALQSEDESSRRLIEELSR
ncbi:flagellar hook basal-body protein [Myxococcota bacterium]|nr:flagellar hook basal-body protein [Myxococcota bacterium]